MSTPLLALAAMSVSGLARFIRKPHVDICQLQHAKCFASSRSSSSKQFWSSRTSFSNPTTQTGRTRFQVQYPRRSDLEQKLVCHRLYATGSSKINANDYCARSHTCGELTSKNIGDKVILYGWLQFKRMGKFFVLKDAYGLTQVLVPDGVQRNAKIDQLPLDSVIEVKGTVNARPEGQVNHKMITGEIEVVAEEVDVLNICEELPFPNHDFHTVNEPLRLKYRYLALRQPELQRNLRLRSNVVMKFREFLCNHNGFVEVETPTLFKATPGGAREFIVPTSNLGKYYTLPQSPQQFKQMLMVGGVDRYMQIARCYRDETARPDRQPEFTQLDLEMSFVNKENIKSMVEDLLQFSWPADTECIHTPFPVMKYAEAMSKYGSDKPDVRYGMTLNDVTDLMHSAQLKPVQEILHKSGSSVMALKFTEASQHLSTSHKKTLETFIKDLQKLFPDVWLANIKIDKKSGETHCVAADKLGSGVCQSLKQKVCFEGPDLLYLSAGTHTEACQVLGRLRVEIARLLQHERKLNYTTDTRYNFLWVEDFPLFLPKEDGTSGLESAHHPFTAPIPADNEKVYDAPSEVTGQHFDLVLNGQEVGGGSIRIHNAALQEFVLNFLDIDSTPLQHLLDALCLGAPPHGGIALGVDRLMAMLCEAESIRDVIAFPKSGGGLDLLAGAPSTIDPKVRNYYNQSGVHEEDTESATRRSEML